MAETDDVTASPAKRTNRRVAIGLVVVVAIAVSAVIFGNRATAPDSAPDTSSTSTTVALPSTGTLERPAETSGSWFDHSFGAEQFDYEMSDLSCDAVRQFITPDVCGVARSKNGDFMLVGSESFWDPADTDSSGIAYIPFQMSVFVLRDDNNGTRASSVLDGFDEKAYSANRAQIDLYKATIGGDDVLVLHKRLTDEAGDAYSFWESVQVIAASDTGAPTVVAAYQGARLQVSADSTSLRLSALRYHAAPDGEEETWYTLLSLSPSPDDATQWTETPQSGSEPVVQGRGLTLLDSHRFPSTTRGPAVDPGNA